MESYPVSERLSSLQVELQSVLEYYNFLCDKGYFVCKNVEYDEDDNAFVPISESTVALFYEMHGIDDSKLETERRRMLEIAREDTKDV